MHVLHLSLPHETAANEARFSLNQETYAFCLPATDCHHIYNLTDQHAVRASGISRDNLANDNRESAMHRGLGPSTDIFADGLSRNALVPIDGSASAPSPVTSILSYGIGMRWATSAIGQTKRRVDASK